MKEYHHLLPLATGYFGASSALYDFDGLIVVYGPAGGAWHINIEDEPRWYRGPATVVGAGLLEMDVILGNDDKFINNIVQTAKQLDRKFVALSGTPISEIIGTDLKGFAHTIEARTNLPVFMVPTAGSEPYPEGASKALLALADKFMDDSAPKVANGVNVLGAIHLSTGKENHLEPLYRGLIQQGYELLSVMSSPCSYVENPLEGFCRAPGAAINAVVSTSGIKLAQEMYSRYGTSFIVGMPVGRSGQDCFFKYLKGETYACESRVSGAGYRHAVVVGEPVLSYGIKHSLSYDFGIPEIDVVSVVPSEELFSEIVGCKGIMAEKGAADLDTDEENIIRQKMNTPDVDIVIADPCYKALLESEKRFVCLPHTAMSARANWDMPYEYVGEEGYNYLSEHM
ncbi:nitrogenase component 1 [Maridesulfovibrio bastinii]|uniref:nitrogenase component 1 n=1 Tax=Maridesulfovibrio bastinii TaxID=47157 RepID=UPI00041BA5BD|nr:nitrogenase component 1 [Maridesulfovibrio bastinii]